MQETLYPLFAERMQTERLANGLLVNMIARPNFHKTYAILTVDFGSIDDTFTTEQGEKITVPAGIAHFLEHKLFEKKDHDAFDLFGKYGADANAFTSYTRTSYLFATTSHLDECMNVLLDFVQTPYFTEQTVAKEKGIIEQEIKMYDDDPSWQLYQKTMANLYPGSQLSLDIAGSASSIAQITAQDLYTCYRYFYQPSNMNLFVIGNFVPNELLAVIKQNQAQKTFPEKVVPQRFFAPLAQPVVPQTVVPLAVKVPKVMLGIRGTEALPMNREGLKKKVALELLLHLLFAETSPTYQELYDQGIVDDSFDYELQVERGFYFILVDGNTRQPEAFVAAIKEILQTAPTTVAHLTEELALAKKEFLGQTIKSINSLEAIANRYEGPLFGYATIFDLVPLVQEVTLADVLAATKIIDFDNLTINQVVPQ